MRIELIATDRQSVMLAIAPTNRYVWETGLEPAASSFQVKDPTNRNTPIYFLIILFNQINRGSIKRPRCISRGTLIPPSASNTFNSCYCFLRNRSLYLHRLLHGTQTILLSLFVPSCIDLLYIIPGNSYFPIRSIFYSSTQTMCC